MSYVYILEWHLYDGEEDRQITAPVKIAFADNEKRAAKICDLYNACHLLGIKDMLRHQEYYMEIH